MKNRTIMNSKTILSAEKIWTYFSSFNYKGACDAIVICCSYDLRVSDYACKLFHEGLSDFIVMSGKTGHWTNQLWDKTEAQVFSDRAQANGIDLKAIEIEDQSTNIGENMAYSRKILSEARVITFVTKPNTLLRLKLTVPIQWPEIQAYRTVVGPTYHELSPLDKTTMLIFW